MQNSLLDSIQPFVYKQTFPFARTSRTAFISDIMNTVYMKAVFIEIFAQLSDFYGFTVFGLIYKIEFHINDGKGIIVAEFIPKRKLFATNTLICFFQFNKIQRIIQKISEHTKTQSRFPYLLSHSRAVFTLFYGLYISPIKQPATYLFATMHSQCFLASTKVLMSQNPTFSSIVRSCISL